MQPTMFELVINLKTTQLAQWSVPEPISGPFQSASLSRYDASS